MVGASRQLHYRVYEREVSQNEIDESCTFRFFVDSMSNVNK